MKILPKFFLFQFCLFATHFSIADEDILKFGIGMFQPDKDKNDATYRPLANYLSAKLNRKIELRTVDSLEGLAKSLANGETDIALLGPWAMCLQIISLARKPSLQYFTTVNLSTTQLSLPTLNLASNQ